MSKPGYPIDMVQTITVHNNYHAFGVPGTDYPGTDQFTQRTFHDDKDGANSIGWPAVKTDNAYSRATRKWQQSPLTVHGEKSPEGDTFWGNWGNLFGLDYDPTGDGVNFGMGDYESDVHYRLVNQLIGDTQFFNVNLGEIYATRQQTADMVGQTFSKIGNAFKSLRSGNVRKAIQTLTGRPSRRGGAGRVTQLAGGVPAQWLALQYGWLPLLGDIHNSLEIVREAYNNDGEVQTSSAYAKCPAPNKSIRRSAQGDWGPEIEYVSTGRAVSGKAEMKYRVSGGFTHSLSQFGIVNPLSIGWELLPYSFVLDWALPIGGYLQSLTYSAGLEFVSGWFTYKHKQRWRSRLTRTTGTLAGGYSANWSGGTGEGEGFYLHRTPIGAFPNPPLPRLKDPFSPKHLANGLSLLSEAFSGYGSTTTHY